MKIRSQLILAFLLLAVVPLAGIVLYSYHSSLAAVRTAVEEEASELTAGMDARLAAVRDELSRTVTELGELPFGQLAGAVDPEGTVGPWVGKLVQTIGGAAPLFDSVEFVPAVVAASGVPSELPPTAAPAPVAPPAAPGAPGEAPTPAAPAPEGQPAAVVIDMGKLLHGLAQLGASSLGAEERRQVNGGIGTAIRSVAAVVDEVTKGVADLPKGSAEGEEEADKAAIEAWGQALAARIEKRVADVAAEELGGAVAARGGMSDAEQRALAARREATRALFGRTLAVPIHDHGRLVGELEPQIRADAVLQRVLAETSASGDEIPFAVDGEGHLHAAREDDRARLAALPLEVATLRERGSQQLSMEVDEPEHEHWVVVTSKEPESGLIFGIARPIGASLDAVRRAAVRNFAYGLGLIALALIGILPLANRMSRELEVVTSGAERIAGGDLHTRVAVRSKSEIGTLARAFNHMAQELTDQRRRLVDEERRRQEQEVAQALLQAEYDRKSRELEEARRFQLSLLPKTLPEHPTFELAVHMKTAAEVGGDYYDFHLADDGTLTLAIGDATGHGATAGTMVTAIKGLFTAHGGDTSPGAFLDQASRVVQRMELGRMAMALTVARLKGREMTVAAAGMPPLFLARAGGAIEEVEFAAMPLGGLTTSYPERRLELAAGDTLLFMSDGFPELIDAAGEPFGYGRALELFAGAPRAPDELLAELAAAVDRRTRGKPPNDDVTFVALRLR